MYIERQFMKKTILAGLLLALPLTSFAGHRQSKFCDGVDNEKVKIGTKYMVTCETDPNTLENVIVKYCYIGEDGSATWSQQYSEYEPEGC